MKTFLIKINTSSYINIFIQKAKNENEALELLKNKIHYLSFNLKIEDITESNFIEVLDYDKPDYEG